MSRLPQVVRYRLPRFSRDGFTLIELLLTLALSVMLMAMIGTALSFYANRLEVRDTEVRRVQLAQSILNMLSDDLRAALYPPEFDDSSLTALLSSSVGGQAEQPGAGEDLSAAGLDDMSEDTGSGSEMDSMAAGAALENTDLASSTTTTQRPGLRGNQTQIQFDVSLLPRIEEYQPLLVGDTPAELTDLPSDIKTVTYYVQPAGGGVVDPLAMEGVTGSTGGTSSNGGLVRRSLDRSVTQWAMQNGGLVSLNASGDLLATEVVELRFRYWDGLIWQIFWDSDQMGGLPLAVEVTLTVVESSELESAEEAPRTRTYEQIIRLPMGKPVSANSASGMSAAGL
jgi:prepilin-type N-terminal cleavage/methylation domain-containing protein